MRHGAHKWMQALTMSRISVCTKTHTCLFAHTHTHTHTHTHKARSYKHTHMLINIRTLPNSDVLETQTHTDAQRYTDVHTRHTKLCTHTHTHTGSLQFLFTFCAAAAEGNRHCFITSRHATLG